MVGLDTHVLVRYIAQDDPRQTAQATALIEALTVATPGFVSSVTLVEAVWVMEDVYAAGRDRLADIVEGLLHTETLVVQAAEQTWRALASYRKGRADFADHLIASVCSAAGCTAVYTFDKAAAHDGVMTLLATGSTAGR